MRSPLRVLLPVAALIAAACRDGTIPLVPGPLAPSLDLAAEGDARRAVFLAPMVRPSSAAVALDAAAQPVVSLVRGACGGAPVVTLMTGGSGPLALKLDPTNGTFHAVWHTKGQGLVPGDHQLCVHEDGAWLGALDVEVVRSPRDLRAVAPGSVGLAVDAPLVIRFGIAGRAPTVGPPSAIVFVNGPVSGTAGTGFTASVEVRDAAGNVVTDAAGMVSISLAPNSGRAGAALQGTTTAALVNGTATFGDLALTLAGSGYALSVSFGGLTATSSPFDVSHGPAACMTLVQGGGQSANVGTPVAIAPGVRITDAFGNSVAGEAVTFAVVAGGGSVSGSNALTDVNGVAVVGSWTLGPMFGPNTLLVSSGALTPVTVAAMGVFQAPF